MSAVSVSESGIRPLLADAVDLARRALLELEPAGVGAHLGVAAEDDSAATHRFEATLPGYRGWQWAVVVAAAPKAGYATVSESALLPGPDALVAPDFVPWEQRIRPGDLAPGDLLAPPPNDPRLVPGYVATGDPVVDEVAQEIGLGRTQVMSLEGRLEAAERWYAEFGPDTEMAKAAPSTCGLCGFYLPLAGSLRAAFGVCGNAMGADGHVVHAEYGCGAHSDTVAPTGGGSPLYEAFDDAAVEIIPTEALVAPKAPAEAAPAADSAAAAVEPSDATVAPDAESAAATSAEPAATAGSATEVAPTAEVAVAESADATATPDVVEVPHVDAAAAVETGGVVEGLEVVPGAADVLNADAQDDGESTAATAGIESASTGRDTAGGEAVAEAESSADAAEPGATGTVVTDSGSDVAAEGADAAQDEPVVGGEAGAAGGRAVESSPQS
ncbi:DUF3027 domain-containing protein [Nocardia brasiliensis]|uniref:DUF3027 domain-containing protein n=1 Tax=Nocardia brasiliensis TaxID=37326 RepID=UPI00367334E2